MGRCPARELAVEPDPHTRSVASELRKLHMGRSGSEGKSGLLSKANVSREMGAAPPSLPDRPSIAVLPFVNMSGSANEDYFADGITEDIITDLSKWRWFFVIARNSTFAYKGRSIDVRQIGDELGVRYVVEGSVGKSAGQLRITAQLIDAGSGSHIWAERFDCAPKDLFAVEDEVSQKIATSIEPALTRAEVQRARTKPTQDMAAWDFYLQGLSAFNRTTQESNEEAALLYERALNLDPRLADAYAGLARVYLLRGNHRLGGAARDSCLQLTVEMAERALSIDDHNPTALAALSLAEIHLGRHEAALRAVSRALQLNPNFAFAYTNLAACQLFRGEAAEALVAIETALRLSPLDPHRFSRLAVKASALYLLRRYQEAIGAAQESRTLGYFHTATRVLAASYAQLGMLEKAKAAANELVANGKGDTYIGEVIAPFLRPEDREHYAEALRKAGLPDTPNMVSPAEL
jgi:adenylate cyclase